MVKFSLFIALAISSLAFTFTSTEGMETISIGTIAPEADLKMPSTAGKSLSIRDVVGKNGVLVVFSCNTCPFVVGAEGYGEGWAGRYNAMHALAKKMGIGMIVINSNEGKREKDDSIDEMKKHAKAYKYTMPYVVDANSVVANAFGARTTPHVFLFNKDLKLVYKGAIDDNNENPKEVKEPYLTNAINELGAGKEISKPETRNVGCSIKRKS